MKIAVIQGSPRGAQSNTRRLTEDIRARFPEHEFVEIQPGARIITMEKDPDAFGAAVAAVEQAEAVLWSFPVYVLLVPSQLKRFVELIHERGAARAFQGKYATTLTTSANFYDHTAHNYMRGVSEDLGMAYVEGFSPSFWDLGQEAQRENLLGFAREFFHEAGLRLPQARASGQPGIRLSAARRGRSTQDGRGPHPGVARRALARGERGPHGRGFPAV